MRAQIHPRMWGALAPAGGPQIIVLDANHDLIRILRPVARWALGMGAGRVWVCVVGGEMGLGRVKSAFLSSNSPNNA
jgi:hypothetical protein